MSEHEALVKLDMNAEPALDFDDSTVVVSQTLARGIITDLIAENAALKRENKQLRALFKPGDADALLGADGE